MKLGLFCRLVRAGIRKNRQLYLPYILTCVCMVMMYYIVAYLACSSLIASSLRGAEQTQVMLNLGRYVIAVFSAIFLFYTNSFLMRRRNREFGLYNILGMNKRNIGLVLCLESVYIYIISLLFGITLGVLFSKLSELLLFKLLGAEINYKLYVELGAVRSAAVVYALVFLLTLIINLGRIRLSKPVELLKSCSVGEKPPKANWFLALLGLLLLCAAYYIAVQIDDPITAMMIFFVAVIMVILASYLLFISGSVALCRLLQKNKLYYYHPSHFVSVSSMAYRMKRNGAGLASICILSTMVLVTITSTSCLFIGGEDLVRSMCPNDYVFSFTLSSSEAIDSDDAAWITETVASGTDIPKEREYCYYISESYGLLSENGDLNITNTDMLSNSLDIKCFFIAPVSLYETMSGTKLSLHDDEALVYSSHYEYPYRTVSINSCEPKRVILADKRLSLPIVGAYGLVNYYYIFVNDYKDYVAQYDGLTAGRFNTPAINNYLIYGFDAQTYRGAQLPEDFPELQEKLNEYYLEAEAGENTPIFTMWELDTLEGVRYDFYNLYGVLFYLGVVLSIVFILAAVLIIYYKQVSEGFEDVQRFEIMKNVGMTNREIKRSIDSQVLTVFFAPLLMAGLHLCFAFPMIQKIITVFGINDLPLLLSINLVSFVVFAFFYVIVYKLTSYVYFGIVSGKAEKNV